MKMMKETLRVAVSVSFTCTEAFLRRDAEGKWGLPMWPVSSSFRSLWKLEWTLQNSMEYHGRMPQEGDGETAQSSNPLA